MNGWIGVDLDGTLAEYNGWKGKDHIGEPIPKMAERVKNWLKNGVDVRIFTARVAGDREGNSVEATKTLIENWCIKHIGTVLPITNVKDFGMVELWDDRAIQVIPNTGKRADGEDLNENN